jgi:hypothetical protein
LPWFVFNFSHRPLLLMSLAIYLLCSAPFLLPSNCNTLLVRRCSGGRQMMMRR